MIRRVTYKDARRFGPVTFIPGEASGKFPSINLIVLESDGRRAVVDPGSNVHVLRQLRLEGVDAVFLSHYHNDHVRYLDIFEGLPTYLHESEVAIMASPEGLARAHKIAGTAYEPFWEKRTRRERGCLHWPIAHPYRDGGTARLGDLHVEFIHLPGHSPGHTALRFVEAQAVYVGDIDLTRFGPWYGNAAADLGDFLRSVEKARAIEAEHYLTAHEVGAVDRATYLERLARFESKFHERDDRLRALLAQAPLDEDAVLAQHPIYRRRFQPALLFDLMERWMIRAHLTRLESLGEIAFDGQRWSAR